MNWEAMVFWAMATLTIVSAVSIVFEKDIVRMAFWLLGTLMGVAGLYLEMGADFLGLTQIMVYIGGINVLLLFGIMLTNRDPIYVLHAQPKWKKAPALLLGALFGLVLIKSILNTKWVSDPQVASPTAARIGEALMTDYILPFEMVSVLLLVILVGAAYVARRAPQKEEPS